jgi:hypothetical protein
MAGERRLIRIAAAILGQGLAVTAAPAGPAAADTYAWRQSAAPIADADTLAGRIPPPPGFMRLPAPPASFASWLRGLPMKPAGAPVSLHTGAPKARQDVHAAVVDIDTGPRDLQQCADAIMRLRAEWLWSSGRKSDIGFHFTDGKRRSFAASGRRDYAGFRKYMDQVFAYAGTYSLARELVPVPPGEIATGDVFIKGGFPGHAVLVADMAVNDRGEKRFLLVQSYMPAQDIHVLKNPADASAQGSAMTGSLHDPTMTGSPWYAAPVTFPFVTPEWTFPAGSLKRWP